MRLFYWTIHRGFFLIQKYLQKWIYNFNIFEQYNLETV